MEKEEGVREFGRPKRVVGALARSRELAKNKNFFVGIDFDTDTDVAAAEVVAVFDEETKVVKIIPVSRSWPVRSGASATKPWCRKKQPTFRDH